MTRGLPKRTGGGEIYVVEFVLDEDAQDTSTGVTTTTETVLSVGNQGGAGSTNNFTRWQAPWPCVVSEVFVGGRIATNTDTADFRIQRHTTIEAATSGTDIIRNAVGGAATDAVRLTASAAGSAESLRYTGIPQDTAVAPGIYAATPTDDATGFDDDQVQLAAGEYLSATYEMGTGGATTTMSHVVCKVTMAKIG